MLILVTASLALVSACGTDSPSPGSGADGGAGSPLPGPLPTGWSGTALESGDLNGVSFIDDQTGWVCSSDVTAPCGIWKTRDGGGSWERVSDAKIADICFLDDATGWAVDRSSGNDALLHTTDGGTTWREQRLAVAPHNLYEVIFIDENNGFIAAGQYGGDHGGWLIVTTDGGRRWRARKVTDTPIRALYFVSAHEGWAAGDQDVLYTADGGRSWTKQMHRTNGGLAARDLWFVDRTHGWLASDLDGSIWATDDGGRSWRASWRDTKTGVCALAFTDEDVGWAVGIRYPDEDALAEGEPAGDAVGLILRTDDGGATWAEDDVTQVPGIFDLTMTGDGALIAAGHAAVLRRSPQP
jgi:photosystem II stability/assembly factor-like uncharacterized protein